MSWTRPRLAVCALMGAVLIVWLGGGTGASQEPPPGPGASEDPAGTPVVGVWVEYRTQGRTVRERVERDVPIARECYQTAFSAEARAPGRYEVCFGVDNPNRDPDAQDLIGGAGVCMGGDYPEFEACLRDAIPPYSAPPDVTSVAVHVVVDTDARGFVGHGSGGR